MPANNAKRRRSDDVDFSSNHPTASVTPSLPAISEKRDADPSGVSWWLTGAAPPIRCLFNADGSTAARDSPTSYRRPTKPYLLRGVY